jgi:hypothetical protein
MSFEDEDDRRQAVVCYLRSTPHPAATEKEQGKV